MPRFRTLRMLYTQLTLGRFVSVCLAKVAKRLFDHNQISSYSQFGEDRIIESFFNGKRNGYYVDVGCNKPIAYSNTWKQYLSGWRGIAIDANEQVVNEFKRSRPRDVAIVAAISSEIKRVDFYNSRESHLISGIGPKTEGHWQRNKSNSNVVALETCPLYELLVQYNVAADFDLLSVDTEGNEEEVIDSLRLDKFAPKLIVIEQHDLDLNELKNNVLYVKLCAYQYRLVAYSPPTAFYAAGES